VASLSVLTVVGLMGSIHISRPGSRWTDCTTWSSRELTDRHFPTKHYISQKSETELVTETDVHRRERFQEIWDENTWGTGSKSGPGSLLENTANIRKVLTSVTDWIKVVLKKDSISILDSSCGDMVWMPSFLNNRTDVTFTGYDIVPNNVENHRERFKDKPWKFEVRDIVSSTLPAHDLILSRHTLQHLTTGDIQTVLTNIVSSNSSFLLATNFPVTKTNLPLDDSKYRFRPVNLLIDPFCLPSPVCTALDIPEEHLDITLWDLRVIREKT